MNTSEKTQGSRSADKFVVRLPDGMRQKIALVAKNYHRSMNSEIVSRLEQSLRAEPSLLSEEEKAALQLGGETAMDVSPQESAIISRFRQLSPSKRQALLEIMNLELA
ncbi:MAG TPA: DNA-binding protein [Gammaproteobacteria bacterium]|nr:DNA-binding protein [Gammaproteobacteria bacterium]MEC8011375.1 Arc family DNA-binding protein [Pseudomonadota bacterium]HBF08052.1 DNA-binding protein [Gammaproteobacteria bacterium]HCK93917.1 DNA-binding protein [Gammaproteobacteria bacterium]|tara:strand:- start:2192 stop:2515 length:324 start_codon:yes stop_codon:yes gene_type:complete